MENTRIGYIGYINMCFYSRKQTPVYCRRLPDPHNSEPQPRCCSLMASFFADMGRSDIDSAQLR